MRRRSERRTADRFAKTTDQPQADEQPSTAAPPVVAAGNAQPAGFCFLRREYDDRGELKG